MARIVIIHHSGIIGGAGVSLMGTIKALAPHHELTVLTSDSPDDILKQLTVLQNEYSFQVESYGHRIGAITYYSGGDKIISLRFLYRMCLIAKQWHYWQRKIREINPDIVIVNSIILSWMGLLSEVKKRKSVCFVRETIKGSLSLPTNRLIRRFLLRFQRVVFLSEYDRQSWRFDKSRSEIIRNYVSENFLDNTIDRDDASVQLGLPRDSLHVLYVGGVSHMKGFDIIVKAVIALNDSIDTDLVVAGVDFNDRKAMANGKLNAYETGIRDYIANSNHRDKIHMVGRHSNMSNCYAAADVLVFPMRSPHQARPVFEAGYFSVPVIISDFDNIKESVVDGETGLLFKPGDVSDLYAKLNCLAGNPELRETMGRTNKLLSATNHSIEKNNLTLLKLISEI